MPILAGLLSTMFGSIASFLLARFSLQVSAAGAFIAVLTVSFLAVKAAIALVAAGLTVVLPPAAMRVASWFMPDNFAACLTAIIIIDAIVTSWDYYKLVFGVASHQLKT